MISFRSLVAALAPRGVPSTGVSRAVEPLEPRVLCFASDLLEYDDVPASAKYIPVNSASQFHNLHTRTDVDWVQFSLASPARVQVETRPHRLVPSTDTEIQLFRSGSNARLAYDDNDGEGAFSKITDADTGVLAAGTYQVRINERGSDRVSTGYYVSVNAWYLPPAPDAFEDDNVAARAGAIGTTGVAQRHNLHTVNDVDWVRFTLTRTSAIRIETTGVAGGDTRLQLYRAGDTTRPIAFNDDKSQYNPYSLITSNGLGNLGPGTYYVRVSAPPVPYDNERNPAFVYRYDLRVTATPPPLL